VPDVVPLCDAEPVPVEPDPVPLLPVVEHAEIASVATAQKAIFITDIGLF